VIIRNSRPDDAAAMTEILNEIIAIGGTTAHQEAKPVAMVRNEYIDGPEVLTSVVAASDGRVVGWQSVGMWQSEAHIGTFVRHGTQAQGVGGALFVLTRELLLKMDVTAVVATIRADNVPGQAYYTRLGFAEFAREPDFALKDGRVVGRVHRRCILA